MSGQPDMANVTPPTISEVAAKRGWQTLAQGLGIDVAVAVALVVATILPGVETWDDVVRLWPAWLPPTRSWPPCPATGPRPTRSPRGPLPMTRPPHGLLPTSARGWM